MYRMKDIIMELVIEII